MKSARVLLWMLPVAWSCVMVAQGPAVGEAQFVTTELTARVEPAAYFSLAEAKARLGRPEATVDADLMAAYLAVEAAMARIRSSYTCKKFFHGEGERALENTRFSVQYLRTASVAAQVEGRAVLLNRSGNGRFMRPEPGFMGLRDVIEIRAFYILHEVAHELSRHTGFVADHMASARMNAFRTRMNNELLLENCYRNSGALVAAR